jgi:AraC-like DNA-binding protein
MAYAAKVQDLEAKTIAPCSMTEFEVAPWGRSVVGEGWLFYGLAPDVFGYSLVGKPDAEAIAQFVAMLDNEGRLERKPHAVVADLRKISGIDAKSFALIADYIQRSHTGLSRWVTRAVLVPPGPEAFQAGAFFGFDAALVTGFFNVVSPPFPISFATTIEAAVQELGLDPAWAASIDAAVLSARMTQGLRLSLRAYLAAHLASAEISGAAKALGVSTRTLQRRLAPEGFDSELAQARVERAKQLLGSKRSLLSIAVEVGFSSTQALNVAFKRFTKKSPTLWRDEERG